MVSGSCAHVAELGPEPEARTPGACEDCLKINFRDWVHLRECLTCGHVGCCDSSPHRHATAHFQETSHPVMRSVETGESWRWCYVDFAIV